jgi:uncharacterized RDD family membrane protein YckC
LLVLLIPTIIVWVILDLTVARGAGPNGQGWVDAIATIVVVAIYFSLFNGIADGQTVGNIAVGIAVRDADTGATIGVGRSAVRWLVRDLLYVFVIPGLLSDLWPLWDDQHQTLADKAIGSVMIRVR